MSPIILAVIAAGIFFSRNDSAPRVSRAARAVRNPRRSSSRGSARLGPVTRIPVDIEGELERRSQLERGLEQRPNEQPPPRVVVQPPPPQPVMLDPIQVPAQDASDAQAAALQLLAYVTNTIPASRNRERVINYQRRMGQITADGLVGPQSNRRVHALTGMWIPGIRH